jgi:hypothetical protein
MTGKKTRGTWTVKHEASCLIYICTCSNTISEIDKLREENSELRYLLKEQLKISGKCCYAKAPAYAQIRQKLVEMGYGPEIITDILGEEL